MNRTLQIKVFVDKDNGLSMTVKHTETEGEPGEKETHSTETTDAWGSNESLKTAAQGAIVDYLLRIAGDHKPTPIEEAAR